MTWLMWILCDSFHHQDSFASEVQRFPRAEHSEWSELTYLANPLSSASSVGTYCNRLETTDFAQLSKLGQSFHR